MTCHWSDVDNGPCWIINPASTSPTRLMMAKPIILDDQACIEGMPASTMTIGSPTNAHTELALSIRNIEHCTAALITLPALKLEWLNTCHEILKTGGETIGIDVLVRIGDNVSNSNFLGRLVFRGWRGRNLKLMVDLLVYHPKDLVATSTALFHWKLIEGVAEDLFTRLLWGAQAVSANRFRSAVTEL